PPRPAAEAAVRACRAAGVGVTMITGDHAVTAAAIARAIGIGTDGAEAPAAIAGRELDTLSDDELIEAAGRYDVFARVSPENKLRLVEALQARGEIVAMTGDGVNDAPALRRADIGVAMGISGTEVAREAADMVLTDDNFATIEAAVEEGRGVFDNLRKFLVWTLPTNGGECLSLLAAILLGMPLPILPIQLLWINMGTSVTLGLTLAFEPKEPGLMNRPPHDPKLPILDRVLGARIALVSVLISAAVIAVFEFELARGSDVARARTAATAAVVFAEATYLFNCRSLERSFVSVGLFSNPWTWAGAGLMTAAQIAFTHAPFMNRLFGSAPLDAVSWAVVAALSLAVSFAVGGEKVLRRRLGRRGRGLAIALGVAALFVPAEAGAAAPSETRPNVVLVVADDLGWSDLSSYGSDFHRTPRLDALAREGIRFTSAYAAAPVCTPTRAALMTGKCPARLHMTIWYEAARSPPETEKLLPPIAVGNLPHEEVTAAEALRSAGYQAIHVGKWHLGEATHYPETQGFDVNVGGTLWGAPPTYFYPYRGPFGSSRELRYVPRLEWGEEGEYLTDRLTDEALRAVERAGTRPFFLHLAHHAVHTPIEGKPAAVARWAAEVERSSRHRNPAYAAMLESLDESVGRLLDKLDALGIAERTVVIFTSDNGGHVGEYGGRTVTTNHPLRSGKGSLYEGGIRVPLIVRWPGVVSAGGVSDEPVISNDLFFTILEIAGVEPAARGGVPADGRSLVPILKDPRAKLGREALFWHYPHYYATTTPVSAVRSGDWKLLEYYEDGRVELYNLAGDLGETRDLASREPERAASLRAALRAWLRSVGAQMPAVRERS
ncbi:MAG: HAD-IC family P-type ATPase, partial [Planctomycetota bacterium]